VMYARVLASVFHKPYMSKGSLMVFHSYRTMKKPIAVRFDPMLSTLDYKEFASNLPLCTSQIVPAMNFFLSKSLNE